MNGRSICIKKSYHEEYRAVKHFMAVLPIFWQGEVIYDSLSRYATPIRPQTYAQAYATVDVSNHITRHSPPTIVIAGEHDHAIPYQSQVQFVDDLTKMGVPHELISIPFTDHF